MSEKEKSWNIMDYYYGVNDKICTWPNGIVIEPDYLTKTFHSIISMSDLSQIRLRNFGACMLSPRQEIYNFFRNSCYTMKSLFCPTLAF